MGPRHIRIDLASPAEAGFAKAGNGSRSLSVGHFENGDAGEERRSHSQVRAHRLRLLARQSASPCFSLLRTSTSRRLALVAAGATSPAIRDAQPTQLQRWAGI